MNINPKEISIAVLAFILSLAVPLFFVWWLFFLLALVFIFYYDKPKSVLTAGFLLDIFYFAGGSTQHYPLLTLSSLILLTLSSLFRDRFRF